MFDNSRLFEEMKEDIIFLQLSKSIGELIESVNF